MLEGGACSISTEKQNDKIAVSFADNGAGMSAETTANIFQPMFTTKSRGRGTGLGLAVVKQILNEHSAEIRAESSPGKGTIFTL